MKFLTMTILILLSVAVFAESPKWTSQPKDIFFQTSIDNKILVTIPEIDLNNYNWSCEEREYGKLPCWVIRNVKKQYKNIKIGNSEYIVTNANLNIYIFPTRRFRDRANDPVTWEDIKNIYFFLEEVDTGYKVTLRLTPSSKRTGLYKNEDTKEKLADGIITNFY